MGWKSIYISSPTPWLWIKAYHTTTPALIKEQQLVWNKKNKTNCLCECECVWVGDNKSPLQHFTTVSVLTNPSERIGEEVLTSIIGWSTSRLCMAKSSF